MTEPQEPKPVQSEPEPPIDAALAEPTEPTTTNPSVDLDKERQLAELQKKVLSPDYQEFLASKAKPAQEVPPSMPNFDDMSKNEMAQFFMKAVNTGNMEMMQKVGGMMGNMEKALGTVMIGQSVQKAENTFPDFNNFGNEIAAIIRANPGIPPGEAYKIARFDYATNKVNKKDAIPPVTAAKKPADPVSEGTKKKPSNPQEAFDLAWSEEVGDKKDLDHLKEG